MKTGKRGNGWKDLTGRMFGRLKVIDLSEKVSKHGKTYWNCECDCGTRKATLAANLLNSHTSSCGCIRLEQMAAKRAVREASTVSEDIRKFLYYDEETGLFTRLVSCGSARAGDAAGSVEKKDGYIVIPLLKWHLSRPSPCLALRLRRMAICADRPYQWRPTRQQNLQPERSHPFAESAEQEDLGVKENCNKRRWALFSPRE